MLPLAHYSCKPRGSGLAKKGVLLLSRPSLLTSALQSRPFSSFKVLPPVYRVFRVSWRCLRRKMMISVSYVEDLAVLKIPDLERDVERSAKAVREEPLPSPERRAKERKARLRMKRERYSAHQPFGGMA